MASPDSLDLDDFLVMLFELGKDLLGDLRVHFNWLALGVGARSSSILQRMRIFA
jgi:hypothetical protein